MSEMRFFKRKQEILPEECAQLLSRLRGILSSELKVDGKKIEFGTRFKEDLDIDSLDAIYIVMALEKEFGIEISDEAAEKFLTVKDIVGYLCGVLRQADNKEDTT